MTYRGASDIGLLPCPVNYYPILNAVLSGDEWAIAPMDVLHHLNPMTPVFYNDVAVGKLYDLIACMFTGRVKDLFVV